MTSTVTETGSTTDVRGTRPVRSAHPATAHKVDSGLGEKLGAALPPGSAGIVEIYDRTKTDTVNTTLASAVMKSAAEVDGGGAKELKAALAEAQAGMGG